MQKAKNKEQKILLSRKDLRDMGIFQSNSSLLRAEWRGTFPQTYSYKQWFSLLGSRRNNRLDRAVQS